MEPQAAIINIIQSFNNPVLDAFLLRLQTWEAVFLLYNDSRILLECQ